MHGRLVDRHQETHVHHEVNDRFDQVWIVSQQWSREARVEDAPVLEVVVEIFIQALHVSMNVGFVYCRILCSGLQVANDL